MCMYAFTLASVHLIFLLTSLMPRPGYKMPCCGTTLATGLYPFLDTFVRLVAETAQTQLHHSCKLHAYS